MTGLAAIAGSGVSIADLDRVEHALGRWLPIGYRHHLEEHGAGPLVVRTGHLVELWGPDEVTTVNGTAEARRCFPWLVRIASAEAREQLALDYRTEPPRVVLLDISAADDSDLTEQAPSFEAFLARAGDYEPSFEVGSADDLVHVPRSGAPD